MSPITFAARFTGRTRDGVTYWSVDVDQNDKTASETENRQSFDSTSAEQDLPQSEGSDPLPKPLRKVSLQQRLEAFALACLPIPFIAMVIGAFLLNNKPQSHRGSYFIQASRLGPTIYPLVFAGIAGKFLRTIALYKAQKGSTLGVIEKLLGSQSFILAATRAISLRSINTLSVGIMMLWILSPLGGQASLRLIYETNSTVVEGTSIYYTAEREPIGLTTIRSNWSSEVWVKEIRSLASKLLLSPDIVLKNHVDPWLDPKIPRFDIETNVVNQSSGEDWIRFHHGSEAVYASMVGLFFMNLSRDLDYTEFPAPYEHMVLNCTNESMDSANATLATMQAGQSFAPELPSSNGSVSEALFAIPPFSNRSVDNHGSLEATDFFLRHKLRDPGENASLPILWLGLKNYDGNIYLSQCSLETVRMNIKVVCDSGDCKVSGIGRRSIKRNPPNPSPGFIGSLRQDDRSLHRFLELFTHAVGSIDQISGMSPFVTYLNGFFTYAFTVQEGVGWNEEDATNLSIRLTEVLNTVWYVWAWQYVFWFPDHYETYDTEFSVQGELFKSNATSIKRSPIYRSDLPWLLVLLLSSIVLLCLGLANLCLVHIIIAPEIFGYASSLLRNSNDGGTNMDSTLNVDEVARSWANIKVQIADSRPEDEIGLISFKEVADEDFSSRKLRKDRLYA